MSLTQPEQERVQRLEKYVQRAEQALQTLNQDFQNEGFQNISIEQIQTHLSHTPDLICDCQLLVAKFRRAWEFAKLDIATIAAELWKECNQKKEALGLTNAKDRDAYVKTNFQYRQACEQEIEYRYQLERMEAVLARYENLYIGARKLASLVTQEKTNYDRGL